MTRSTPRFGRLLISLMLAATSFALPSLAKTLPLATEDRYAPTGFFVTAQDNAVATFRPGYTDGSMNGLILHIPDRFLLGPVLYLKPEISNRRGASQDNDTKPVIADFSILLRLSNFRPIESNLDLHDWTAATSTGRPGFDSAWMMVDVDNRSPIDSKRNSDLPMWLKRDPVHRGPFVREKELRYDLIHYDSTQSVDSSPLHGHFEYFYDAGSSTNIVCETKRRKVVPFDMFDNCQHRFLDPELNVVIEVFYTKKDLPRWKVIEEAVIATIRTFKISGKN